MILELRLSGFHLENSSKGGGIMTLKDFEGATYRVIVCVMANKFHRGKTIARGNECPPPP